MEKVRAKKHLGQHFLHDNQIAENIVLALKNDAGCKNVLEIGPGMGVLTQFLVQNDTFLTSVVDIDKESIVYLKKHYSELLEDRIIEADFLRMNLDDYFEGKLALIGNFPYNISTQIFFKVLENRDKIPEIVGMVQKEVAERIASIHGNKVYGITSVLIQAFYDIEYLFTVHEDVFTPPPKVKSGVIRLTRNKREQLPCDEKLFFTVVKQSFSTRRKTLRNCLKGLNLPDGMTADPFYNNRAEQLSVEDFIALTVKIEATRNQK